MGETPGNTLTHCQAPCPGFNLENMEVVDLQLELVSDVKPDRGGRSASWLMTQALGSSPWLKLDFPTYSPCVLPTKLSSPIRCK